jgi:hypothetical protein
MRDSVGGAPDSTACGSAAQDQRANDPAPELNGTWEVSFTLGEYKAAGADPVEKGIPANWGHFTFVFHGKYWSQLGRPDGAIPGTSSGTYAVKGNQITFYRSDSAYPGSNSEIWGPYIWSVYRDTLTFRKSSSFVEGPTGLVVKAWRRVG